jgi:hypothetical protein
MERTSTVFWHSAATLVATGRGRACGGGGVAGYQRCASAHSGARSEFCSAAPHHRALDVIYRATIHVGGRATQHPSNADGSNGDFYFRSDGTGASNSVIYHKEAGAWVALVTT